jgi:hypothetical protein
MNKGGKSWAIAKVLTYYALMQMIKGNIGQNWAMTNKVGES